MRSDPSRTNDDLVDIVESKLSVLLPGRPGSPRLFEAMRAIDRKRFLPEESRDGAYLDEPMPIGLGQTCSQPSMVAIMLSLLDIEPGDALLEIGAGSGYAAAIATALVWPEGRIFACELRPELLMLARGNCARLSWRGWPLSSNITFLEGDGSGGFPAMAPFNRILLSAGVNSSSFREAILFEQLAANGVLVYPEARGRLHRLARLASGTKREAWGQVVFVPLLGKNA